MNKQRLHLHLPLAQLKKQEESKEKSSTCLIGESSLILSSESYHLSLLLQRTRVLLPPKATSVINLFSWITDDSEVCSSNCSFLLWSLLRLFMRSIELHVIKTTLWLLISSQFPFHSSIYRKSVEELTLLALSNKGMYCGTKLWASSSLLSVWLTICLKIKWAMLCASKCGNLSYTNRKQKQLGKYWSL